MAEPNIQEFLKQAQRNFAAAAQRAKENPGFGQRNPDGRYIARLAGAEIKTSRQGNVGVNWTYVAHSPAKYKGRQVFKWQGLSDEDGLVRVLSEIALFGVDIESISSLTKLPSVLAKLVKSAPWVELKLSTTTSQKDGKEYQNCYLQEVKDEDFDPDSEEIEEEGSDESEESGEESEEETEETETEETEEEEEEEEQEPEEEGVIEIAPGMRCEYSWQGETAEGVIRELLEETESVKIATEVGGKVKLRTVKVENIVIIPEESVAGEDEEEEEEAPAPKPASGKKPAGKK